MVLEYAVAEDGVASRAVGHDRNPRALLPDAGEFPLKAIVFPASGSTTVTVVLAPIMFWLASLSMRIPPWLLPNWLVRFSCVPI